jgi:predicted DNA-binding protein (UPF0251 family)
MSYAEASEVLQHIDQSMLDEFAAELAQGGQQVVASTPQVTVLDSIVPEETTGAQSRSTTSWLRSLHFNDRLDYVQSCVRVTGTPACPPELRVADHSQPPPAHGATATHLHLLLVAVGLHRAIVTETEHALAEHLRIVVLGAGGCSVPAYLATALRLPGGRPAEIDAVELNDDVVAAARVHFGIQDLEEVNDDTPSNRLRVHRQCALAWVKAASESVASESVDVLIVDLQGGNAADRHLGKCEVYAPPLAAMDLEFLHEVTKLIRNHPSRPGVVAFNCIATPEGLIQIQERLRHGLSLAKVERHMETTERVPATHDNDVQMWAVAPVVEIEHSDGEQQKVLHRVLLCQLGGQLPGESDPHLDGAITDAMHKLGLRPASFVLQTCR